MVLLPENFEMDKYGIHVRLVNEDDAEFTLSLRTNERLSRFIHSTENNLEKQIAYIREYKCRELQGLDYYFIYFWQGAPAGVNRIYHITDDEFTFGSWVFDENLPYWVSCAGAIIAREIGFEVLGKEKEVDVEGTHEDNKGVIMFSRLLGMNFDGERMDEKGKYLTGYMEKKSFENNKQRIIRTFPIK